MRLKEALGLAVTLALAPAVFAQPRAAAPAQRQGPVPLYQQADLSRPLNLTPQQVNQLNQLTNQTQAQYREEYGRLNALPPVERAARAGELDRRFAADWTRGAQDVL